eukprot:4638646-Pleurochrysis_carterae.AAC.5
MKTERHRDQNKAGTFGSNDIVLKEALPLAIIKPSTARSTGFDPFVGIVVARLESFGVLAQPHAQKGFMSLQPNNHLHEAKTFLSELEVPSAAHRTHGSSPAAMTFAAWQWRRQNAQRACGQHLCLRPHCSNSATSDSCIAFLHHSTEHNTCMNPLSNGSAKILLINRFINSMRLRAICRVTSRTHL